MIERDISCMYKSDCFLVKRLGHVMPSAFPPGMEISLDVVFGISIMVGYLIKDFLHRRKGFMLHPKFYAIAYS
jgi:hypothetical protein